MCSCKRLECACTARVVKGTAGAGSQHLSEINFMWKGAIQLWQQKQFRTVELRRRPRRLQRCTYSGSPPVWAVMEIRFRSPRPPSPASKMFCWAQSPASQGASAQSRARLRKRRRLHEVLVSGRRRQARSFRPGGRRFDPQRKIKKEGYWAALGTDPKTGQPITTNEWIDRLAPKALAVVASGTCATYGGIHAMEGNPTGCMGLADYLGWDWQSKAGLPIVNVPGCPVQPDNFMETVLYLLYQVAGLAPMIPLDDQLRPTWLFGKTVHEGCDRAGYYEQGDFAEVYGSPKCIVKLGCWGPVVNCNVPKRGWMAGIGGCPNVGGICIGCTMPGFPDKFMPFMDEPPGARVSTAAASALMAAPSAPCAS